MSVVSQCTAIEAGILARDFAGSILVIIYLNNSVLSRCPPNISNSIMRQGHVSVLFFQTFFLLLLTAKLQGLLEGLTEGREKLQPMLSVIFFCDFMQVIGTFNGRAVTSHHPLTFGCF